MKRQVLTLAITLSLFLINLNSCTSLDEWQPAIDNLTVSDTTDTASKPPCNGDPSLCDKRYNEVAYATTNRSYRYQTGIQQWQFPHQEFPVHRQLRDGVRAISLDVKEFNGDLVCYFGIDGLEFLYGTEDFLVPLQDIEKFLADSSLAVVTLFLNSSQSGTALMSVIDQAGLTPFMHAQEAGQDWPTLQQMIDSNKRLVVFVNDQDAASAIEELHFTWDWVAATNDEVLTTLDFSCAIGDGNEGNDLYMLRHNVTASIFGVSLLIPNQDSAVVVNDLSSIYARSIGCKISKQHQVNFLSVDFYKTGDVMQTINLLNGVEESPF